LAALAESGAALKRARPADRCAQALTGTLAALADSRTALKRESSLKVSLTTWEPLASSRLKVMTLGGGAVCVCVCVCVCACDRERESERERVCACVCVGGGERRVAARVCQCVS
jgi:hypothetical protein